MFLLAVVSYAWCSDAVICCVCVCVCVVGPCLSVTASEYWKPRGSTHAGLPTSWSNFLLSPYMVAPVSGSHTSTDRVAAEWRECGLSFSFALSHSYTHAHAHTHRTHTVITASLSAAVDTTWQSYRCVAFCPPSPTPTHVSPANCPWFLKRSW